ncbi:hypothetical protein ABZX56_11150 [Streptomyces parvulus]|uniref:hypothetical protein n=1 Tax=Streptomyces parvulus TaxID=146923 RepID=UPI00339F92B0
MGWWAVATDRTLGIMLTMGTEVLVGVIGLSGALVGAAAAFAAVVYQQKHQARLAQAERRDALAQQAVELVAAELEQLRRLLWPQEGEEPTQESTQRILRHIDAIRLAVLRLPHQELREAIEAACMIEFGRFEGFQQHVGLPQPKLIGNALCWDAQKCLGAYLRQEPLPETAFLFKARTYFDSMLSR